ncbi:MAG: hypothetical protein LBJ61_01170, partial [Deltaproteobacteria bacterium]|nr:hypothetical protein [Deltaproteobacteria bacterium]
ASRGKYGKNRDKVLLYCRSCGHRFAATRDTPLFGAHLSPEQTGRIIYLAAKGVGIRATGRLLGLSKNTVKLALEKIGGHCRNVYCALMRDLQLDESQLDDLWTFVKRKRLLAGSKPGGVNGKPGSGKP